ncbi:hypothetical protein MJO29_007450 [Puccinia striiformis f. sp. tritici]|nr:hypothetical protein MJO29_007450 [Puccinia striiformis f. sp. tritici]
MLPEANRNPPATEYYQEMTTTEEEDNTPASKKQVVSANHSLASAAIPVGSLLAQTRSTPGNNIATTLAGRIVAGEKDKARLVAEILREQQLDRLKNIADHRLKNEAYGQPSGGLSQSPGLPSHGRSRKTPAIGARSITQSTSAPLTCHTDGNICNAINMRISELVALQERTYELLQQAEKRASEEEVRAATREAQANRRADMLEQMLLSLPGPNNFTIY